MNKIAHILLSGITSIVLTGCESGLGKQTLVDATDNSSTLTLSTPDFLQKVRAIDSADLIVNVIVNGTEVEMVKQSNEWSGTALVPAGEVATIELLWSEVYRDSDEPLKLAIYRHTTSPITDDTSLPLSEDDYSSALFDDDNDGISNITERRSDSDPRDGEDPGTTESTETDMPVDITINRIDPSDSPSIDGEYDDIWNNAKWTDDNGEDLKIDTLIEGSDSSRQNGATEFQWIAMHDGSYLYLLVVGEDAEGSTQYADSEELWHDDTLELFLDGDNSKNTSYDEVDDYQLFIPHLKLKQPLEANNIYDADHRKHAGSNTAASDPWPPGLEFVNQIHTGFRHSWEIRIRLSEVGIEVGRPFGIDLQYDDDQDGGNRDAKWSWKSETNETRQNPSLMGTAILE